MTVRLFALASVAVVLAFATDVQAQTRPAFPQKEGLTITYRHYDASDKYDADCSIILRNVRGGNMDGSLDMVYKCKDSSGEPYFGGNNECVFNVRREKGQTYINMDKMSKTMKMMNLITAGDVSSICVPMSVGSTLPDTQIFSTLGVFKATLTISDKKVLDHKIITVAGRDFECWLVHEKILTKTPFSTDVATADTWYAEGVGCVNQTVYDAKGKLKGRLELRSIRN